MQPLSKDFLLQRGLCCGKKCLNCPYIPKWVKNSTKTKPTENRWTIIYGSDPSGNFIHEDHLRKSNPDAQILKLDFTNNLPKYVGWRQCDLIVRNWMKSNKHRIENNNVALIEYDVLVTKKLPDINLNNQILSSKYVDPINDPEWHFFKEKYKLGYLEEYACGLLFFGFYMMSRNCIDFLTQDRYDFLFNYEADIFCELRFATVLKHNGVSIGSAGEHIMCNIAPGMDKGWVSFDDIEFDINTPGFYHPVKTKINISEHTN